MMTNKPHTDSCPKVRPMTHEERNNLAAIIASLLINIYVIMRLTSLFESGRLDGPDAIMIWARAMLWVIPIGILLVIGLTILVNILAAIAANDPNPSFIVDERDKAISNFGMKITGVVLSIGFIAAMIALAVGVEPLYALIGMYFGFSAGDLAGNIGKMMRYRRGY